MNYNLLLLLMMIAAYAIANNHLPCRKKIRHYHYYCHCQYWSYTIELTCQFCSQRNYYSIQHRCRRNLQTKINYHFPSVRAPVSKSASTKNWLVLQQSYRQLKMIDDRDWLYRTEVRYDDFPIIALSCICIGVPAHSVSINAYESNLYL